MIPPYLTLTNTTTNENLYTIATTESASFTFQVSDQTSASVIQGALVTITRDINGVTTQIFSGLTDSAGTVSLFLSSTTPYTVRASKAGCGSNTATVTPVGSYNMQLNCAGNLTQYSSQINGVTYVRTPADGTTTNSGVIYYSYRVNSVINPMTAAKFILVDQQGNVVATMEHLLVVISLFCNGTSCSLTLQYNSVCGDNIKGRYYINLGNVSNDTYILLEEMHYGDLYVLMKPILKIHSQNFSMILIPFFINGVLEDKEVPLVIFIQMLQPVIQLHIVNTLITKHINNRQIYVY